MNIQIGYASFLFAALGLVVGCGNLDDHSSSQNVAYAPDGSLIVFTDAIRIFDGELRNEIHKAVPVVSPNEEAVDSFVLSADGTTAAVSHATRDHISVRNAVKVFRIPTGELVNDVKIDIPPTPPIADTINVGLIALSPQGNLVYAQNRAAPPGAAARESDSSMFRVSDGARLWGRYWLTSPMFSADGKTLFATFLPDDGSSGEFDLMAFDALTGTVKFRVDIKVDADIALVGNGELIAGVWEFEGGTASALWSATDGSLVRTLPPTPDTRLYGTHPAGFYPAFACWLNGDLCAVGFSGSTSATPVTIWRTDGTLVRTIQVPFAAGELGAANDFAFSPDGQLIAIAGDKTAVYRISDGARVSEKSFPRGIF